MSVALRGRRTGRRSPSSPAPVRTGRGMSIRCSMWSMSSARVVVGSSGSATRKWRAARRRTRRTASRSFARLKISNETQELPMTEMHDVTTGYVDVDGTRLYYEMAGTGHPLIMLHAGIANLHFWDDQWEPFSRAYRVVRYDLRGYG